LAIRLDLIKSMVDELGRNGMELI